MLLRCLCFCVSAFSVLLAASACLALPPRLTLLLDLAFLRPCCVRLCTRAQILKELQLTPKQFEEMKKFRSKGENECVVCLDKPKDHVIFNCMHLCLCEDCVVTVTNKKNAKCPLCSKKIT